MMNKKIFRKVNRAAKHNPIEKVSMDLMIEREIFRNTIR